jgi:hypothetical protein
MKSYLIFCCPGAGGLFLTSVVAQLLQYNCRCIISDTGHAHNMGNGNWKGHRNVCTIGDHWDLNYRPEFSVYYSHLIPDNFLKNNRHIQPIYIDADRQDFKKITEMYVKKAWPDLWSEEEYNKWAGVDYPPYSRDNIEKSTLIQNDLINDFEHTVVKKWYDKNPCLDTYKKLNFRTIMGIDQLDLLDEVCKIINKPTNSQIQQYIFQYQALNQKLYF